MVSWKSKFWTYQTGYWLVWLVRALSNVNVDEKIYFFTKTLLNIIQNFISHETITCDGSDPSWINKEIKKLMV